MTDQTPAIREPIAADIVPSAAEQSAAAGLAAIEAEAAVIAKAAPIVQNLIDGGMAPARYLPTYQERKGAKPQGRDVAIAKGIAAAVYGATLGFGVARSLQNVFTVHGTPAIYARTMVALVMAQGHEVWTGEAGPTAVTVYGRRKGTDAVESSTWTIARAKAAGFTSNAKYQSQPEEMLYAKAAATVCRRLFPDVLEGVPYTVEDLEAEPHRVESRRVDRPAKGNAAARALVGLAPAEEPGAVDEQPAQQAPAEPTAPAGPTAEDLLAALDEAKIAPAERKAYLEAFTADGRDLTGVDAMTADEIARAYAHTAGE